MKKKQCERMIVVTLACVVSAAMVLTGCSCRGQKRDAAYYEQMVDSIRRAEQLKTMRQQMGNAYDSPADAFFDTLRVHTLPLQSADGRTVGMDRFSPVPDFLNDYFGYPSTAKLHALALPPAHRRQVVLLAEGDDEQSRTLYVYVMDKHHRPIDIMCVEEQHSRDPKDDSADMKTEFYITSNYEITLSQSYHEKDGDRALVFQNRRFVINQDGHFEETIIEY